VYRLSRDATLVWGTDNDDVMDSCCDVCVCVCVCVCHD
jgi:hypothetical protein